LALTFLGVLIFFIDEKPALLSEEDDPDEKLRSRRSGVAVPEAENGEA
jgi:hypothetical protein